MKFNILGGQTILKKHPNQIRFETQNKLLEFQLAENHDKTETNPTK